MQNAPKVTVTMEAGLRPAVLVPPAQIEVKISLIRVPQCNHERGAAITTVRHTRGP